MYKTELCYGIIAMSGNKSENIFSRKTGSHIDYKLKYSKCANLHNCTKKGGQSANRIHRIGLQKRQMYLNEISEKAISYFLTNNNTKYIVKDIIK